MADDVVLDSLQRRMTAMHSLWYQAVSDMTVDQVKHVERAGVLPIACSLFHQAQMEDVSLVMLSGLPPIWQDDWAHRIGLGVADHGKHKTVAGTTRLDGTECWIYQHGLRHMGELEHARALVGLGGMTS